MGEGLLHLSLVSDLKRLADLESLLRDFEDVFERGHARTDAHEIAAKALQNTTTAARREVLKIIGAGLRKIVEEGRAHLSKELAKPRPTPTEGNP